MRLIKYRVTDFRSVIDSGWIDAEQVTALVGVNESGKTNLLLPLWKLNPAIDGELRPNSDYPKTKYGEIRDDPSSYPFISALFETGTYATKLEWICGVDADYLRTVEVSRYYDGEYRIVFPGHQPPRNIEATLIHTMLSDASAELNQLAPLAKEGSLKDDASAELAKEKQKLPAEGQLHVTAVNEVLQRIGNLKPAEPASTSAIVPCLLRLEEKLSAVAAGLKVPFAHETEKVVEDVLENLPKFVYYSNYGNLDSEIYLPHVVEDLKREDLGSKQSAKARTLKVLFSFVRLTPAEILELGRDFRSPNGRKPTDDEITTIAEDKRTRTTLLHSAEADLTKKFRDWWKQGDYSFQLQADGDHFRIWVSDAKRPEKVELEDRSTGLQWFLSFYLVFLVERRDEHKNAILLLDEPGLSLHPLAQRDLSDFFENLSQSNQIIYTTHSPFLIDADMLERARKVYVAEDGTTKATADLRRGSEDPRKSGATYAIYSALNMNIAESVLYGCTPVIVEGPSDQHYLTAIKTLLIAGGLIKPSREVIFTPAHGAGNAKVIAAILSGKDENLPIVLFDADAAGRKMSTDLMNGLYQNSKDRVLSTKEFCAVADSEVEDLFPPELIAEVVDKWQRGADSPFLDVLDAKSAIIPQIERWATKESVALHDGWKVELSRAVKKRCLARPSKLIDETVLTVWAGLFERFSPK